MKKVIGYCCALSLIASLLLSASSARGAGLDDFGEEVVRKAYLDAPDRFIEKTEIADRTQEWVHKEEMLVNAEGTVAKDEILSDSDKPIKKDELLSGRQECVLKNELSFDGNAKSVNATIGEGSEAIFKGTNRTINFNSNATINQSAEQR